MLASLVGVIFTWRLFGNFIKRNTGLLVSFSAGVFLVLIIRLSLEAFEQAHTITEPIPWIIVGIFGVILLFKILPSFHHHHSDDHEDDTHSNLDAQKIVISDSIHNIGDGVLLVTAFSVSLPVGIAATISIFIHEIVQEISEFFVLKQSGLSTKKALLINFLSSSTILIGSLGGFFLLEQFEAIEVPLLALSTGAFLVVVFQDLIPESVRHSKREKSYLKHGFFFTIGIIIMLSINGIVGHSHGHSDEHEGEYNDGELHADDDNHDEIDDGEHDDHHEEDHEGRHEHEGEENDHDLSEDHSHELEQV